MIRHDVDDVTHAVRAQCRYEQLEVIAVTDLRVEGVVVDHVVAVGAARAARKYGEQYTWLIPSAARYGTIAAASRKVKPALSCTR